MKCVLLTLHVFAKSKLRREPGTLALSVVVAMLEREALMNYMTQSV